MIRRSFVQSQTKQIVINCSKISLSGTKTWQLLFNQGKCVHLQLGNTNNLVENNNILSPNGDILKIVTEVSDLGVC